MTLYMGGDFVIRKDITLCASMYVVDSGKVMLLGQDATKPYLCCADIRSRTGRGDAAAAT